MMWKKNFRVENEKRQAKFHWQWGRRGGGTGQGAIVGEWSVRTPEPGGRFSSVPERRTSPGIQGQKWRGYQSSKQDRGLLLSSVFPESILKVYCLKDRDLIRGNLLLRKYLRAVLNPSSPPESFLPQFFSLWVLESLPRPPSRHNKREESNY